MSNNSLCDKIESIVLTTGLVLAVTALVLYWR
jgi:hypothetical protein